MYVRIYISNLHIFLHNFINEVSGICRLQPVRPLHMFCVYIIYLIYIYTFHKYKSLNICDLYLSKYAFMSTCILYVCRLRDVQLKISPSPFPASPFSSPSHRSSKGRIYIQKYVYICIYISYIYLHRNVSYFYKFMLICL